MKCSTYKNRFTCIFGTLVGISYCNSTHIKEVILAYHWRHFGSVNLRNKRSRKSLEAQHNNILNMQNYPPELIKRKKILWNNELYEASVIHNRGAQQMFNHCTYSVPYTVKIQFSLIHCSSRVSKIANTQWV